MEALKTDKPTFTQKDPHPKSATGRRIKVLKQELEQAKAALASAKKGTDSQQAIKEITHLKKTIATQKSALETHRAQVSNLSAAFFRLGFSEEVVGKIASGEPLDSVTLPAGSDLNPQNMIKPLAEYAE